MKNPNIPIKTENIVNFHFSYYKSLESISCHCNQSYNPTKKNAIYVEADVINMFAKYQLHPPYGFWEEFFYHFRRLHITLFVDLASNQIQQFRQKSYET